MWGFQWPGDHPSLPFSSLTYFAKVEMTPGIGAVLAGYLAARPNSQEVVIVAHSLGCRLALETLEELALRDPSAGSRVPAVFLLAAAVPAPLCEPVTGRFPECISGGSEYVIHSRADTILRLPFTLGQKSMGVFEEGPAVGRDGDPGKPRWTDLHRTNLDHSDYWSSRDVAEAILRWLGLSATRSLDVNQLDTERLARRVLDQFVLARGKLERRLIS